MIKTKNIVFHELSKLFFVCENSKMERWMNMNPYYRVATTKEITSIPSGYFYKNK